MVNDPDAPTNIVSSPTAIEPDAPPPSDAPPSRSFERGEIVDRYTILERVGKGGMGEVYAAFDAKLDRRVALKLLLSSGPEFETRLSREAQAMARLSHPNVVSVFDTGVVEGRLFIAMEFVQGATLRGWQRASTRSVAELLRVYIEAGRGLAAAHEAGLVHRDFKPDNVLVASSGMVKVTDFGLVRAAEERGVSAEDALQRLAAKLASVRPPPPGAAVPTTSFTMTRGEPRSDPSLSSRVASLDTPMTEAGALLGTLGYMAPEQYLSEPVNARTDQFAFCVALYDALYGQKPFAGEGVMELASATVNGVVRDPPRGSHVPARIHRVLLRGLRPSNEARYPSMQELLDDLVRDPAQQRRRIAFASLGVLAVLGLVFATQRFASARQGRLCSGADALVHDVWNDEVKQGIERSFLATGLPFAPDTWTRTREQMDQYMARWSKMHEQTCRATRIDGHQPEALMTMRMACLEQRRGQARVLVRVLSEADRQTVEKAVEASSNLPSVADCADVTSLTTVKGLPADPGQRAAIDTLSREIGDLRVRSDAGKFKDVAAKAPAVVERARAVGYEPVLAEALFVQGEVQDRLGMKSDAAGTLRDSFYAAESGRAEDLKERALIALISVLADQRKFDDARATSRLAAAVSQRLADPEAYTADFESANAWVLCRDGKFDESAVAFHKAIAVAERTADAKPVRLARMYSRAGGMLGDAGHFDEAFDLLDRADTTFARVLGPDHPARMATAVNRSATLIDQGRWQDALATTDSALERGVRVLPPESGTLANLHSNRGTALNELGRYEEALAAMQRSVDIGRAVFGAKSVTTAGFSLNLAETLAGLKRNAEAVAAFTDVLAIIEPALPADHEWLAEARAARGEANVATHASRAAIPDLESAVAIYGKISHKTTPATLNEALAQDALARALWDTGVKTPRVYELANTARSTFETLHDVRAGEIATWIDSHPVAVASR